MSKKKKKADEMDLETSSEKPKRRPMKKAVLVGLKPPAQMMMKMKNSVDVKAQILRMKKHLMERRGFPEDKIIVIIEDEEEDTKPTATNIRDQLYRLVECSYPGDILFIHLIAYGCSDGLIVTPDHKHIDDTYFRALIVRAVRLCCNLTFISDCLIQPIPRCPCPKTRSPVLTMEERLKKHREFWSKPDPLAQATFVTGFYGFVACTNLSHVDLQGEEEEETETTPTCLPSRVILFTPFPCDHNVSPDNINDVSEVVYPPPTGHNHRPYGAFTNSILNVIEQTPGPVTNLELAQKAMIKLGGGQTPPRLSCSHLNYARAPFVC
jgi:hypothetical protein